MQMIYDISNRHDIAIHKAQKAGLKFQCPSCWDPRAHNGSPVGCVHWNPGFDGRSKIDMNENIDSNIFKP
jgi:hypothetical protein